MQDYLEEFLSDEYKELDYFDQMEKVDEIEEKFNESVRGKNFSEEEGKKLLSEGLLGVLKMRCPELEQNEVFNFYIKLNSAIQELETRFQGHPYSDIINEIQSHLQDENSEDYNIWKAMQLNYSENYFWLSDKESGEGGQREDFIKHLEMQKQMSSPLEQKETELSSLEAEAKTITEAEALISQQKEGKDLGE